MAERESEKYLYDILKDGEVWKLKSLLKKIHEDNPCQDLQKHCGNVSELENYLKEEHPYTCFVENGRVAMYKYYYEDDHMWAVNFFVSKLRTASKPVQFDDLMRYVDNECYYVKDFINAFYPGKTLKRFFQLRPHLFMICEDDDTVHLIEEETAQYFKQRMEEFGEGLHYLRFRDHVAEAPVHVKTYVNTNFPGNKFRILLDRNSGVFKVDEKGRVYLVR